MINVIRIGVLAIAVLSSNALTANPYDEYLLSPGKTGDPVVAAKMFAWCSARHDFAAWIEPADDPKRVWNYEESARGARAAGAYSLYMARAQHVEPGTTAEEVMARDFAYYLTLVEGMAEKESGEIDRALTGSPTDVKSPGEIKETIRRLIEENLLCWNEARVFQEILVGKMTPAQIAEAKSRGTFGPKVEPPDYVKNLQKK